MASPLRTAAPAPTLLTAADIRICLRHPRYVLASCETCTTALVARLAARG